MLKKMANDMISELIAPEDADKTCRIPLAAQEEGKEPAKLSDITWRIFRIMSEFVEGFQFLSQSEKEITVFGSARLSSRSHWYKEAQHFGELLAKGGFTTITGGGPGIMEAANRGATSAGGESIGLNIQLPSEQRINKYVKTSHAFHYFFTRKVMMAASAQAYVYFPGGFGTLDELFEMITLIQTGKAQKIPIVLVGRDFWAPMIEWISTAMVKEYKTISASDMKLFTVVDTAKEAYELVRCSKERSFF